MADPRFYDNNGPFSLAEICKFISVPLPAGVDGSTQISDVAALSGAGPAHLSFFANSTKPLPRTGAAVCLVSGARRDVPGTVTIPCASVQGAFATVVSHFYPESGLDFSDNAQPPVHPSARLGKGVRLGHGVVVGANAEIGDGTRLGHNVVIGRGVAIGRNCEIGSNVTISHAYIGDNVLVLPGVQIGQPGFGFASGTSGHVKIPQVGRVIVQDKVEIGACTTIDRGALGDTVVGEGTKIDNLVQIGHNTHIGRHCVIVAQVGISGSCEIGDFVVLGGQAGVADHAQIGDHARIAARGAVAPGFLPGAQDYGGVPVRPLKQWARELAAVAMLARRRKRDGNG